MPTAVPIFRASAVKAQFFSPAMPAPAMAPTKSRGLSPSVFVHGPRRAEQHREQHREHKGRRREQEQVFIYDLDDFGEINMQPERIEHR